MRPDFRGRHVLLLQGPAGPFFKNVARELQRHGARVSKLNFNAGDELFFFGTNAYRYRGSLAEWPTFFRLFVIERQVDEVMLFGDCRAYHRQAIECARALALRVWVFEEGYIRPDYLTLEEGGVNGFSSLPRDPEFYRSLELSPLPSPLPVGPTFYRSMARAMAHSIASTLLNPVLYPSYRHHRDVNCFRQGPLWARGGLRKAARAKDDDRAGKELVTTFAGRYFLVPLQVDLDSQLTHSRFANVAEFIEVVVDSFARSAPRGTWLVFKHHPMDRPYNDYTELLRELGRRHHVGPRLWYVDTVDLPAVIRHALGAVVINSTVGLSSIHHGTPLKCLGKAIYDMEGLTHQGPLDEFWTNPGKIDRALYERFRWWLILNTQVNGSVWSRIEQWPAAEANSPRPPPGQDSSQLQSTTRASDLLGGLEAMKPGAVVAGSGRR